MVECFRWLLKTTVDCCLDMHDDVLGPSGLGVICCNCLRWREIEWVHGDLLDSKETT